jgi:nitrogen fixation NifU-like protein
MDDFYREEILEHYTHPHHYGRLAHPDLSYEDSNPLCGDRVRFDLVVGDGGRVTDVRFSGVGCAISKASASMITDLVLGKTLEEVRELEKDEVLEELGVDLGPVRLKCALLPLKVVKAAAYGLDEAQDDEDW